MEQYFTMKPELIEPYKMVTSAISDSQCDRVGLVSTLGDWEYPIWILMKSYGKEIDLEHILVGNKSQKLYRDFAPCAIIVTAHNQAQTITYQDHLFIKSFDSESIDLYEIK